MELENSFMAGPEPGARCLQNRWEFNLSYCFGCAYSFAPLVRLLLLGARELI